MKKLHLLKENIEEQYDEMFDYEMLDNQTNRYPLYLTRDNRRVLTYRTYPTVEIILNEHVVTQEELINYLVKYKKS